MSILSEEAIQKEQLHRISFFLIFFRLLFSSLLSLFLIHDLRDARPGKAEVLKNSPIQSKKVTGFLYFFAFLEVLLYSLFFWRFLYFLSVRTLNGGGINHEVLPSNGGP